MRFAASVGGPVCGSRRAGIAGQVHAPGSGITQARNAGRRIRPRARLLCRRRRADPLEPGAADVIELESNQDAHTASMNSPTKPSGR
jgi:hypothetical protein